MGEVSEPGQGWEGGREDAGRVISRLPQQGARVIGSEVGHHNFVPDWVLRTHWCPSQNLPGPQGAPSPVG